MCAAKLEHPSKCVQPSPSIKGNRGCRRSSPSRDIPFAFPKSEPRIILNMIDLSKLKPCKVCGRNDWHFQDVWAGLVTVSCGYCFDDSHFMIENATQPNAQSGAIQTQSSIARRFM